MYRAVRKAFKVSFSFNCSTGVSISSMSTIFSTIDVKLPILGRSPTRILSLSLPVWATISGNVSSSSGKGKYHSTASPMLIGLVAGG